MGKITRRDFLRQAAIASVGVAAAVSMPSILEAAPTRRLRKIALKDNAVILFQGDSITDNGRRRNDTNANSPEAMGYGYAAHTAANLLYKYPEKSLKIYNKGISGNRVYQLRDRWEEDCFALKPDVLSILIGVNDYWHALDGAYDGTPAIYRRDYLDLIDKTMNRLPDLQLVICQPFAVLGARVVNESWYPGFYEMQDAAKEVADKYGAIYVPFQKTFDDASKKVATSYWTFDGVHSSMAGSQLMAAAWLDATGLK